MNKQTDLDFEKLGLAPKLLKILNDNNFLKPTPIQSKTIPITLEGKDIVGIAQTGTGKTLAFGLPMLQLLAQNKGKGLVILPTRELAAQVNEHLNQIGQRIGLRTSVLIGGENIRAQIKSLRKNPHILVGTPGRIIDHLQRGSISLKMLKILVLDEADMMFDMGFAPQVREILKSVPPKRQTMLFSATMPPDIVKIISKYMKLPIRIEVDPAGTAAEKVSQKITIVKSEKKLLYLKKYLNECRGSVLIFVRTKFGARNLTRKLNQLNFRTAEIHSNRSLVQRKEALQGFKNKKYRILVATDIAARGIDVKEIELVINYDLPDNLEDYVHRIGRTGRAGKEGTAISLATPSQFGAIKKIEKLINKPLTLEAADKYRGGGFKAKKISKNKETKNRHKRKGIRIYKSTGRRRQPSSNNRQK